MIIISLFDMVKHSFDEIIKEKHRREKKVKYNCFNILYSKMCSIRGCDFKKQFSVYGLYVWASHVDHKIDAAN